MQASLRRSTWQASTGCAWHTSPPLSCHANL